MKSKIESQFEFIESLFNNLSESCNKYIDNEQNKDKVVKYSKEYWDIVPDRNSNKTCIKRKIIMLRQELLNLSKELDNE